MKPILLLTSTPAFSYDGYAIATRKMLQALRVPIDIRTVGDEAIDADNYSAAIFYRANATTTAHKAWLNGTYDIPVVVYGYQDQLHAATGCATGATDFTHLGAAPYNTSRSFYAFTDQFTGKSIWVNATSSNSMYTLAAGSTSMLLDPAGTKSCAWYNENSNGVKTYFFGARLPVLWVLTAVAATGLTPDYRFPIILDMDDGEELTTTPGIYDLADFLREHDAVCTVGIKPDHATLTLTPGTSGYTSTRAAVRKAFLDNTDVFGFVIHEDDEAADYWYDDTNYATVAAKLVKHAERVAACVTAGFAVEQSGYCGHYYMNQNRATRLGYQAIAKAGVKHLRTLVNSTPTIGSNDQPYRWTDTDGTVYGFRQTGEYQPMLHTTQTIEDAKSDVTVSNDDDYGGKVQCNDISGHLLYLTGALNVVGYPAPRYNISLHGKNFDKLGSVYENPGLNWMRLVEPYVLWSKGPWMDTPLTRGWLVFAGQDDLLRFGDRKRLISRT